MVILGRGIENMLDPAAAGALVKYVSQGGGNVVFARGQAYDADTPAGRSLARDLAALEPVVWGRGSLHNLSLQLTLDGRANPCFAFPSIQRPAVEVVPSLPGFLVMPVIEREKAATVVLARMAPAGIAGGLAPADSTAQAGVAMMPYGRGRCLAVLGEGLWRWSLLSPSQKAFDGVYDAFWSDIIRYLAMGSDFLPGRVAYLHLGRSSVAVGQPVLAEAGFRGDAPVGARLTITGPDGRPQQVALTPPPGQQGRLAGRFTPTQAGTYRAMLEVPGQTPQGRWFSVYDLNVEKLNTAADAEALALLARQSGGLVLADGDAKDLAGRIAAHQASQAVPPRLEYIWNTAALLTIMMVWLAGEWLARRKVGLL